MIPLLLLCSLHFPVVWTCLPMNPGEEMPCPSVPEATEATGFVTAKLQMRTDKGDLIYYCSDPYKLVMVEGTKVGFVDEGPVTNPSTLRCNANSGFFSVNDKRVENKKYICGKESICPALKEFTGMPTVDAVREMFPKVKFDNMQNTIFECPSPSRVYGSERNAPMNSFLLNQGDTLVCGDEKTQYLRKSDGTSVDALGYDFACVTFTCQKCNTDLLLDQSAMACASQGGIFCKGKPNLGTGDCPVVTCMQDTLYVLTSETTADVITDSVNQIKCDNGVWMVKNAAYTGPGFVCGSVANCEACKSAQSRFFGDGVIHPMAPFEAKPLCVYTCESKSTLQFMGMTHNQAVCRMDTAAFTIDNEQGTPITTANPFSCVECTCTTSDNVLREGKTDLCTADRLCVKPTVDSSKPCEATCTTGTTMKFKNTMGITMSTTSMKCSGETWMAMGTVEAKEFTCEYAAGEGYSEKDPNGVCMELTQLASCPPDGNCDFSQVIFYGSPTTVACREGALISDKFPDNPRPRISCNDITKNWDESSEMVTCQKSGNLVKDCTDLFTKIPATDIISECMYGTCYMRCSNNRKLQYNKGSITMTYEFMTCYGEPLDEQEMPAPSPEDFTCVA